MERGHLRTRIALVAAAVVGAGVLVSASASTHEPTRKPAAEAPLATAVVAPQVVQAAAVARPRCFGAASMAKKRCYNPALKGKLIQRPGIAKRETAQYPGKQCYQSGVQQIRLNRGC